MSALKSQREDRYPNLNLVGGRGEQEINLYSGSSNDKIIPLTRTMLRRLIGNGIDAVYAYIGKEFGKEQRFPKIRHPPRDSFLSAHRADSLQERCVRSPDFRAALIGAMKLSHRGMSEVESPAWIFLSRPVFQAAPRFDIVNRRSAYFSRHGRSFLATKAPHNDRWSDRRYGQLTNRCFLRREGSERAPFRSERLFIPSP